MLLLLKYCEIRKAFVGPSRMPRLRLAFKRLTDSRAACAISRFFALCYVCQHVDRFWSVFLGKLLLPYMQHAHILFSDWFPQETEGRGSHHMVVALKVTCLWVMANWKSGQSCYICYNSTIQILICPDHSCSIV